MLFINRVLSHELVNQQNCHDEAGLCTETASEIFINLLLENSVITQHKRPQKTQLNRERLVCLLYIGSPFYNVQI